MANVRIAINGAGGRMGRTLLSVLPEFEALQLGAVFEREQSPVIGADAGVLGGWEQQADIRVSADIAAGADQFDLLVDFTTPESTLAALEYCRKSGKAMIIGTTGCSAQQRAQIETAGADIPIVFAPNFSVGVNLSLKLLEVAAQVLGDSVDVEVIGAHHRHKVDSPSGTALAMGEAVAKALGRNLDDVAAYTRHGRHGARPRDQIGFSTIHAGDIVGEHTVMFAGDGERLEITHKATDRAIFARGALRAAQWLAKRPAGLYDMQDVLGLR